MKQTTAKWRSDGVWNAKWSRKIQESSKTKNTTYRETEKKKFSSNILYDVDSSLTANELKTITLYNRTWKTSFTQRK